MTSKNKRCRYSHQSVIQAHDGYLWISFKLYRHLLWIPKNIVRPKILLNVFTNYLPKDITGLVLDYCSPVFQFFLGHLSSRELIDFKTEPLHPIGLMQNSLTIKPFISQTDQQTNCLKPQGQTEKANNPEEIESTDTSWDNPIEKIDYATYAYFLYLRIISHYKYIPLKSNYFIWAPRINEYIIDHEPFFNSKYITINGDWCNSLIHYFYDYYKRNLPGYVCTSIICKYVASNLGIDFFGCPLHAYRQS